MGGGNSDKIETKTTPNTQQEDTTKIELSANINADKTIIKKGQSISFDTRGTVGTDMDGASYVWLDADGNILSTSQNYNRVFETTGKHTQTLRVTNEKGEVSERVVTITVLDQVNTTTPNTPPVAKAQISESEIYVGEGVRFTSDGSYDSDGEIIAYEWRDMDGILLSTEASFSRGFPYAGSYKKILTVVDDRGGRSSASVELVVKVNIVLNQPYNFSASFTDNERVDISWEDVTDGESGYKVYRDGSLIATLGADVVFYSDTEIEFDKVYEYEVSVFDNSSEVKSLKTSVVTEKSLGYNENKLVSLDENGTVQKVTNQSWIYPSSLNEEGLRTLVLNYPSLTILGYDKVEGLLVEYDEENYDALKALLELEYKDGIFEIENRILFGKDIFVPLSFNDYGDKENWNESEPLGANWHLEYMNLPEIWEKYTTGNQNASIGILEPGYNLGHEDLIDNKLIKPSQNGTFEHEPNHGNAVLGIIAAKQNNKKGISGINNGSNIYAYGFGKKVSDEKRPNYFELIQKFSQRELSIINFSSGAIRPTIQASINGAKHYVKNAKTHPNTLYVIAAGNGFSGTAGEETSNLFNGWLKKKYRYRLNNDNIINVAMLLKNGKLDSRSMYGYGVDIAAPGGIKTLKSNKNKYYTAYEANYGTEQKLLFGAGFNGTSAAAPMITGIASLMISLRPSLKAHEIKNIMIETAIDTNKVVTERNKFLFPGTTIGTEAIDKLPAINAKAAMEFIKDLNDKNAYIIDSYDIKHPTDRKVIFKVDGDVLENSSVTYNLFTMVGEDAIPLNINQLTTTVKSNTFEIPFSRLSGNSTLLIRAKINGKRVLPFRFDIMLLKLYAKTFDGQSINKLDNLSLLRKTYGTPFIPKTLTNYQCGSALYLKPLTYDISANSMVTINSQDVPLGVSKAKLNYRKVFVPKHTVEKTIILDGTDYLIKKLKVYVLDKHKNEIDNVILKLKGLDFISQSFETDENGEAFITVDSMEDFYNLFITQNGIDKLLEEKIVLLNDRLRKLTITLDDYVADAGIVKGSVKDITNNRQPLENAKISIYAGDTLLKEVVTDAEGNFVLEGIPSGITHKIIISKEGYLDSTYDNVIAIANDTITLETVLQIDIEYSGIGAVSGKITNAINGVGIDALTLNIRKGINVKLGTIDLASTTDASGYYNIPELNAGVYTVEAVGEGFITGYFTIISIGTQTTGNQNYSITPILPEGETRIVLTWGETPSDLDSQLTGPIEGSEERFHIFYSKKGSGTSSPYSFLDHDDTSSYGPETITIKDQKNGIYRYSVLDFSNKGSNSSSALGNSDAKIKVYRGSSLIHTFNVPNNAGTFWTVFEIEGNQIIPINKVEYVKAYHPTRSRSRSLTLGSRSDSSVTTDVILMRNLPEK